MRRKLLVMFFALAVTFTGMNTSAVSGAEAAEQECAIGDEVQDAQTESSADNLAEQTQEWETEAVNNETVQSETTEEEEENRAAEADAKGFVIENGVLTKYQGTDANVVIPDGVTSIGGSAFYQNKIITTVTIPEGVTSIGKNAFYQCTNLFRVTLPDSLVSLGQSAFSGCEGLLSITLPEKLEIIGGNCFDHCYNITKIVIPDSVTNIGKSAFNYCSGLTNVTLSNNISEICEYTFGRCSSLTSITIPDKVTNIARYAFGWCSSLTSITIPNSVISIGEDAFTSRSQLVIHCGVHSYAKQYAVSNGIKYDDGRVLQTITADNITKVYGEDANEFTLDAKTNAEDAVLMYQSANESVAVVDDNGKVTIKAPGTAKITIVASETDEYLSTKKEITLVIKQHQIITAEDVVKTYGDNNFYVKAATNADAGAGVKFTYQSDNPNVADISSYGYVTIVGAGTAKITIKASETGIYLPEEKTITLTVNKKAQIITAENRTYEYGDFDCYADGYSNVGSALKYTVDEESAKVLAVDENTGKITILSAGTAVVTIYASATDNYLEAEKQITVTVNKKKQTVQAYSITMTYGDPNKFINASSNWEGALFTYTSDNPNVVTVDADGKVTSIGAGTANVTIKADGQGKYEDAETVIAVTVNKRYQNISAIDITKTYNTTPFSLNVKTDADGKLTYEVANHSVVSVDQNGKAKLQGYGKTLITVTAAETPNYYGASTTMLLTVKPGKAVLSSVKAGKSKTLKVKWKKDTKATGYEIQYSTDKNFRKKVKKVTISKNKTTSTTIKKLKGGKKYYVRVCAVKKISGGKLTGAYSKAKSVKVKK